MAYAGRCTGQLGNPESLPERLNSQFPKGSDAFARTEELLVEINWDEPICQSLNENAREKQNVQIP